MMQNFAATGALQAAQQSFNEKIMPGTIHDFQRTRIIYEIGKPAETLYQVVRGLVAVYIPGKTKKDKASCLRLYAAGDYFGQESLGSELATNLGTAEALVHSQVIVMSGVRVRKQCESDPEAAAKLIDLALAFAQEERKIAQICSPHYTTLQMLVGLLLYYGEHPGLRNTLLDGVHLKPLTHQMLASAIGTTREIVTQRMTQLRRKHYIRYSKAEIFLEPTLREALTGK